jgi:glycosyltransferase involved in cell wall biosynthesis
MKRIVFLSASITSGGAEHQMTILMDQLVRRGYDVTLASFGDDPDHYPINKAVHRVHLAPRKSTFAKVMAVQKYLLTAKMDVEFAFSQRMSVLSLFILLLRPRVKVISGERNYTIGRATKFERILLKTGIYRRANYIVPNSYSQGRYLASIKPYLKKKIHVITNYTDINEYLSSPLPHNDAIRIGIFCRFEKQKNFVKFVRALAILKDTATQPFHIDWYGNHTFKNPTQICYFEEGLSLINKHELQNLITIHDPTNKVAELIPSFDALCLPSLFEGFSNSISEYICCGRPVVCSDVSDNSVMVHDGENGFLFDPENTDDIVKAFNSFFSLTLKERTQMAARSREIAESLFDKEKFISSYMDLIEN